VLEGDTQPMLEVFQVETSQRVTLAWSLAKVGRSVALGEAIGSTTLIAGGSQVASAWHGSCS